MRPQLPLLLAALLQLVHTCYISTLWPLALHVWKQEKLREHVDRCSPRLINMLIDRGEHVLSPPAAPASAVPYAPLRLYVLSRYLESSVQ